MVESRIDRAQRILREAQKEYDELIKRDIIRVSDACKTLCEYILNNAKDDHLANGTSTFTHRTATPFLILPTIFKSKSERAEKKLQHHSKQIDDVLRKDASQTHNRKDILVFGAGHSRYEISKFMKSLHCAFNLENVSNVPGIQSQILLEFHKILKFANQQNIPTSAPSELIDRILQAPLTSDAYRNVLQDLKSLVQNQHFLSLFRTAARTKEIEFSDRFSSINESACLYFFKNLDRYASPNYKPTIQDYLVSEDTNFLEIATKCEPLPSRVLDPKYDFTVSLHLDILVQICQYLPARDISNLLKINKKFVSFMKSSLFWEKLSLLYFGISMKLDQSSFFALLNKKRNAIETVEGRFNNTYKWRAINISQMQCERRKIIHFFENVYSVLFVFDLLSFDYRTTEASDGIDLWQESVHLFEEISGSSLGWFQRAEISVAFVNYKEFCNKCEGEYFKKIFPGIPDRVEPIEFLQMTLKQLSRRNRHIVYFHTVDCENLDNVAAFWERDISSVHILLD